MYFKNVYYLTSLYSQFRIDLTPKPGKQVSSPLYHHLFHKTFINLILHDEFKPTCEAPFTIEFENDELPKEELKRLIFEETVSINAQSIANLLLSTKQADTQ
jgi:hypothetical protein